MIITYNTQSTNSYINGILVVGLIGSITNTNYNQTYNPVKKASFMQNDTQVIHQMSNNLIHLLHSSSQAIKNKEFNFLKVDEELDKEIDMYLASYTGKDIEILDL